MSNPTSLPSFARFPAASSLVDRRSPSAALPNRFLLFSGLAMFLFSSSILSAQIQMSEGVDTGSEEEILDRSMSRSSGADRRPSFSADGRWITFESSRDGNNEIYLMASDGKQQRRLTYHEATDSSPAFSPDGKHIVFQANRVQEYVGDRRQDLFLIDTAGKRPPQRLTEDLADDAFASFSPDGQWIIFCSSRGGNVDLYRMHRDGSNLEQLTDNEAHDLWPSYSPDGKHIVFFSKRDNNDDLYLIPADGGEERRLTTHESNDFVPSFYPGSDKLIFVSLRDGHNRLYTVGLDGSEPVALEPPPAGRATEPRISPDGSFLIFVSNGDDHDEIYRRDLEPGRPSMVLD